MTKLTSISAALGFFLAVALLTVFAGTASAQTQQLPISVLQDLLPSTYASPWLDPVTGNILIFDTFGKRNAALNLGLGTTVEGRVMVTDLGDGTQRVTVIALTKNAICWGFNSSFQPAFGFGPVAVANQFGPASLGYGTLHSVFEPQPVGPLIFPWPEEFITVTITCDGQLREGSGFPEGTAGMAHTTQVGRYGTGVPGGCPPEHEGDCFPAERVQFKPTGN
jgi:hypothetical protein